MQIKTNIATETAQHNSSKLVVVTMSKDEALSTIKSLIEQIQANNPNVGRYEEICNDGICFTIAVTCAHHREEVRGSGMCREVVCLDCGRVRDWGAY